MNKKQVFEQLSQMSNSITHVHSQDQDHMAICFDSHVSAKSLGHNLKKLGYVVELFGRFHDDFEGTYRESVVLIVRENRDDNFWKDILEDILNLREVE